LVRGAVLALSGFVITGLDVVKLTCNPRWMQKSIASIHYLSQANIDWVMATIDMLGYGYIAAVVILFVARHVRLALRNARRGVVFRYGKG